MATIEVPDTFEIVVDNLGNECAVRIKLWGQTLFRQEYPFPSSSELKVSSAIMDTKKDFVSRLGQALRPELFSRA